LRAAAAAAEEEEEEEEEAAAAAGEGLLQTNRRAPSRPPSILRVFCSAAEPQHGVVIVSVSLNPFDVALDHY
jgi:hypothetical protein